MVRKFVLIVTLFISGVAFAEPITGPISKIRDGDTFLIGDQPIRICGIDAPEAGTKAGRRSTEYLRQLTKGKSLRCIPVGEGTVCDGRSKRTSRDRIVAQCFLQNRDLAELLVKTGNACDWPRFSNQAYKVVGGCSR